MKGISFRKLLLDFYKKLGMTENEVVVILLLDDILDEQLSVITSDVLSTRMNLSAAEIDKTLLSLTKKNFITYEKDKKGKLITSLKPLNDTLFMEFHNRLEQKKKTSNKTNIEDIRKLYNFLETSFGRSLSHFEIRTIEEWLENGYTIEKIRYAAELALINGTLSVKTINSNLLKLQRSEDFNKEGYSIRNNTNEPVELDDIMSVYKTKFDEE